MLPSLKAAQAPLRVLKAKPRSLAWIRVILLVHDNHQFFLYSEYDFRSGNPTKLCYRINNYESLTIACWLLHPRSIFAVIPTKIIIMIGCGSFGTTDIRVYIAIKIHLFNHSQLYLSRKRIIVDARNCVILVKGFMVSFVFALLMIYPVFIKIMT